MSFLTLKTVVSDLGSFALSKMGNEQQHSNSTGSLHIPLSSEDYPVAQTVVTPSTVTSTDTNEDKCQHHEKRASTKIVGIAATFWNSLISTLSAEDELVSLYLMAFLIFLTRKYFYI